MGRSIVLHPQIKKKNICNFSLGNNALLNKKVNFSSLGWEAPLNKKNYIYGFSSLDRVVTLKKR